MLLICSSVSLVTAETILTRNIRVYSENMLYYANIAKSADNNTELSVSMVKSSNELWSSWLDWGNDYSGYLSNDGSFFVAANSVYSENHNLITVYHREKQESYTVKSIPMNKEFLKLINGKYLWIDTDIEVNRGRFLYDGAGAATAFEIVLNDRRVLSIKLK